MQQLELVHDDVWAALRGLVSACGGSKVVGPLLWPSKPKADSWLDDCLNPDRQAKLCLEEFFLLLRIGRERGFHAAKHYVDDVTFYERSHPASPSARKAELQERFIASVNYQASLLAGIKECEAMEAAENSPRFRSVK
jgi:hypothetical protein